MQVALWLAPITGSGLTLFGQTSGAASPCVDVGLVVAVHEDSLAVTNDDGTKVYRVDGKTEITRGGTVSLSKVRVGDSVMLWCAGDGSVATDILVNFTRWGGTVTAIYAHSFVMYGEGRVGEAPGHVTVRLNGQTNFDQSTIKDLRVGRGVEVSGSIVAAKRVHATAVRIFPSK